MGLGRWVWGGTSGKGSAPGRKCFNTFSPTSLWFVSLSVVTIFVVSLQGHIKTPESGVGYGEGHMGKGSAPWQKMFLVHSCKHLYGLFHPSVITVFTVSLLGCTKASMGQRLRNLRGFGCKQAVILSICHPLRAAKWLQNLKTLKVQNLGFLLLYNFYTDHIKFHILIVICEFCYILHKTRCQRENYVYTV